MKGLSTIDIVIAVVYILSILSIGVYFSRKQKSAKDFLLGGKSMGWFTIGLSLLATLTSAVGYMSFPAAALKYGTIMLWMWVAIPVSYPVVTYVFMPFYHKLNVYTAYEYLERRFSVSVRLLTSAIFILWRVTWMGAVIYVPSLMLNVVTGGQLPLVPSIITLGVLSTLNTTLGGVKAVMWADVIHSLVMFAGMIIALTVIVYSVPGGLPEIWGTLTESGKTRMTDQIAGWSEANILEKGRLYVLADITVISLVVSYSLQKMGNYCVDQALVQRYLTARSLKISQQGFLLNCFSYTFYIVAITLIGVGLFVVAKYHTFPETLASDQVFPFFIANMIPAGLTGLLVAAIYAASMSSMDSGTNSCVSAVMNDFYARLYLKVYNLDEGGQSETIDRQKLKISRISSVVLGIGIGITIVACYIGRLGDIFTITAKLINMFAGPLFGIFILGMFTRRANAVSVLIAGLVGAFVGMVTVFAKPLGLDVFMVGKLWPLILSFLATYMLGYVLSFVIGKNKADNLDWTWKKIMARKPASVH
ncbi:MAG: sodium/solute symporter [Cyclobacteriaceae bacterium]|nr:sodium/solute symporter [Cyclobacteriaceae bacterium]